MVVVAFSRRGFLRSFWGCLTFITRGLVVHGRAVGHVGQVGHDGQGVGDGHRGHGVVFDTGQGVGVGVVYGEGHLGQLVVVCEGHGVVVGQVLHFLGKGVGHGGGGLYLGHGLVGILEGHC